MLGLNLHFTKAGAFSFARGMFLGFGFTCGIRSFAQALPVIRRNLSDEDNSSLRSGLLLHKTTYCGFVSSSLGPGVALRLENIPSIAKAVSCGVGEPDLPVQV